MCGSPPPPVSNGQSFQGPILPPPPTAARASSPIRLRRLASAPPPHRRLPSRATASRPPRAKPARRRGRGSSGPPRQLLRPQLGSTPPAASVRGRTPLSHPGLQLGPRLSPSAPRRAPPPGPQALTVSFLPQPRNAGRVTARTARASARLKPAGRATARAHEGRGSGRQGRSRERQLLLRKRRNKTWLNFLLPRPRAAQDETASTREAVPGPSRGLGEAGGTADPRAPPPRPAAARGGAAGLAPRRRRPPRGSAAARARPTPRLRTADAREPAGRRPLRSRRATRGPSGRAGASLAAPRPAASACSASPQAAGAPTACGAAALRSGGGEGAGEGAEAEAGPEALAARSPYPAPGARPPREPATPTQAGDDGPLPAAPTLRTAPQTARWGGAARGARALSQQAPLEAGQAARGGAGRPGVTCRRKSACSGLWRFHEGVVCRAETAGTLVPAGPGRALGPLEEKEAGARL